MSGGGGVSGLGVRGWYFQHALRQTPQGQIPLLGKMATAADGTHPTGKHSCFKYHFIAFFLCNSTCVTTRCNPGLA